MKTLTNCKWPGNIRELENFIERAVILSRGRSLEMPITELRTSSVDAPVLNHKGTQGDISRIVRETISEMSKGNTRSVAKEHDEQEREAIMRILRETKGRVGGPDGAAMRMAVNRTTLISRIKKFGIDPKLFV
jgi:formate hydrogenlyase transcriptional activator